MYLNKENYSTCNTVCRQSDHQIPSSLEEAFMNSMAGEPSIHSLQLEYIIKQSIKSVSIWKSNPIPIMLKGLRKKSKTT